MYSIKMFIYMDPIDSYVYLGQSSQLKISKCLREYFKLLEIATKMSETPQFYTIHYQN